MLTKEWKFIVTVITPTNHRILQNTVATSPSNPNFTSNAKKSNFPSFSFTFHPRGTVPLTLPRDYKASGSSQKSASLSSVRAVKAMQLSQFLPARPGS